MTSADHQRKVAIAFIETFKTLDVEANVALRAPDCKHTFAPSSLPLPPARNNADFAEHLASLKHVVAGFPVSIKELSVPEKGDTVTIWAESDLQMREEAMDESWREEGERWSREDWKYRGEYVFVLTFEEGGGEKLSRVLEFVDSKATMRVLEMGVRARENLEHGRK